MMGSLVTGKDLSWEPVGLAGMAGQSGMVEQSVWRQIFDRIRPPYVMRSSVASRVLEQLMAVLDVARELY